MPSRTVQQYAMIEEEDKDSFIDALNLYVNKGWNIDGAMLIKGNSLVQRITKHVEVQD